MKTKKVNKPTVGQCTIGHYPNVTEIVKVIRDGTRLRLETYCEECETTYYEHYDFLNTDVVLKYDSNMKMIPVESSLIEAVGYDTATEILQIKFQNGGLYIYLDVDPETYANLMTDKSMGHYYNTGIKGLFTSEKVK